MYLCRRKCNVRNCTINAILLIKADDRLDMFSYQVYFLGFFIRKIIDEKKAKVSLLPPLFRDCKLNSTTQ